MAKEYHSRNKEWIQRYFEQHADIRVRARDIYAQMKAEGMNVNLATIYRNLERLTSDHVLSIHQMSGDEDNFYQYMAPKMECARHLHLLCSRCGKIIHLNCGFMQEISEHLMAEHGFELDCGNSIMVGLCRECREKEKNARDAENAQRNPKESGLFGDADAADKRPKEGN